MVFIKVAEKWIIIDLSIVSGYSPQKFFLLLAHSIFILHEKYTENVSTMIRVLLDDAFNNNNRMNKNNITNYCARLTKLIYLFSLHLLCAFVTVFSLVWAGFFHVNFTSVEPIMWIVNSDVCVFFFFCFILAMQLNMTVDFDIQFSQPKKIIRFVDCIASFMWWYRHLSIE